MNTATHKGGVTSELARAVEFAVSGQHLSALDILNKLSAAHSSNELVHFNRGLVLQELRRWDEAIESYSEALRLQPQHIDSLVNIGNIYRQRGEKYSALRNYCSALDIRSDAFHAAYNAGTLLLEIGKADEAVTMLDQALKVAPENLDARFYYSVALHQAGLIEEAIDSYQKFILIVPEHVTALVNLGVLLMGRGDFNSARDRFRSASEYEPNASVIWRLLGSALSECDLLAESLESFMRALELDYRDAESARRAAEILVKTDRLDQALEVLRKFLAENVGSTSVLRYRSTLLRSVGRNEDALADCQQLLTIEPNNREMLLIRAGVLCELGRPQEALNDYGRLLAADANLVTARVGKAVALHASGRSVEAADEFEKVLQIDRKIPEAEFGLGVIAESRGDEEGAIRRYQNSIAIKPTIPALINLCVIFNRRRLYEYALEVLNLAVQLDASRADSRSNRALTLQNLERLDEAAIEYQAALQLDGNVAETWLNYGVLQQKLKRLDDAMVAYSRAGNLRPDWAEPHYNAGVLHHEKKEYSEAISSYEQALLRDRCHPEAHMNLGMANLSLGRLAQGWAGFEWRFETSQYQKEESSQPGLPKWQGENLNGRRIMVVAEQGFGDSVQFIRFAKVLHDQGASLSVVVPGRLVSLFRTVPWLSRVSDSTRVLKNEVASCHFYCRMMSLPFLIGARDESDLAMPSTLFEVPSPANARWASLLRDKKRSRIGVTWQAGTRSSIKGRNVSLAEFKRLFDCDLDFVVLQKEITSFEREIISSYPNVSFYGNEQEDFLDASALINQMDLVITVDTVIAHLAPSLGKETWVLLPYRSDWRWFEGRRDSPWYPSVTLFRQNEDGMWSEVLNDIKASLIEKR